MLNIFLTLLLSLFSCNLIPDTNGAETKEVIVNAYLRALEKRDEQAILSLIPKTHIAENEVHQIVKTMGGYPIRNEKVEYRSEFGPKKVMTTIHAICITPQGEYEFKDNISLEQIGERWYLILGRHKDGLDPTLYPPSKP